MFKEAAIAKQIALRNKRNYLKKELADKEEAAK